MEATSTNDYASLANLKERYSFLEDIFTSTLLAALGKASASFRNSVPADPDQMMARYRRALLSIARERGSIEQQKERCGLAFPGGMLPSHWTLLREIEIQDSEGGLAGRIDRVEKTPQGIVITDFKSTSRSDVPARYANQVKLYAALWQQLYGTWPVAGQLRYLLSNATYHVPIVPPECLELLEYARSIPSLYAEDPPAWQLANPGEACIVCGFRPWCEPFWSFREHRDTSIGRISRMASVGIMGTVQHSIRSGNNIRIRIRWANRFAMVVAPCNLFPHAERLQEGVTLRIIDAKVTGQSSQPTIRLDQRSELFFLDGSASA